jgi:hypothetical protein
MVGLAKNAVDGTFTCDNSPKSVQNRKFKVNKQSVHLEIKCNSGCSETWDVALGRCFGGAETLLGHSERGPFVNAPIRTVNKMIT